MLTTALPDPNALVPPGREKSLSPSEVTFIYSVNRQRQMTGRPFTAEQNAPPHEHCKECTLSHEMTGNACAMHDLRARLEPGLDDYISGNEVNAGPIVFQPSGGARSCAMLQRRSQPQVTASVQLPAPTAPAREIQKGINRLCCRCRDTRSRARDACGYGAVTETSTGRGAAPSGQPRQPTWGGRGQARVDRQQPAET